MLAVVFDKPNKYKLAEVAKPLIAPGKVLIQVKSTTICGTDLKMFQGHVPYISYPHIPGHEFGGLVEEIGEGVVDIKVGDKVGVEVHVGCGSCSRCNEGFYNLCLNYGNFEKGHAHIGFTSPGGLAEFCLVPAEAVHVLPGGLNYDHGAFTDAIGIVLWAIERAGGIMEGENVGVVGPGTLGLLAVQAVLSFGAGQTILVGTAKDEKRMEIAEGFGDVKTLNIHSVDDPISEIKNLTNDLGADLVLEFAGTTSAANFSLNAARRGGRVVLGGATSPGTKLEIDLSIIVRGHLDVFGTMANPKRISQLANIMMGKGEIDIQPLITHHMKLSQFDQAWDIFSNRTEEVLRILLHPGEVDVGLN